jgi:RNA polymerase sigma factor (sigma-70 family)
MAATQYGTVLHYLRWLADAHHAAGLDDVQLLERFARHRDEAAFAVLLQRHGPMVFGVCRRVLRDSHDAEDAFQATFLIFVRKASSISKGESVGCWLHEVACRTALRSRSNSLKRLSRERQARVMTEATSEAQINCRCVDAFLDDEMRRLPEQYRRPLVLCYLEGKTHAEAADQLGCPKGTVSGRLARARELLRQRLAIRGVTLTSAALSATLTQEANAAVPAPLLYSTLRTGLAIASGRAAEGCASAGAVTLAKEVMHIMVTKKLRVAVIALAMMGLLGGGLAYFAQPGVQPRQPAGIAAAARGQEKEALPAGATARMGATAFRHGDRIRYLAYTPDGKKLVTSSMDQTVRLWDAATGRELRRFDRSPNASEKDLPKLAQKTPGGSVILWDAFLTAVSTDGKYLAATRKDVVIWWELESGRELHRVRGPWAGGNLLAFAEGGKTLLHVDQFGTVKTWDVAKGKEGKVWPRPPISGRVPRSSMARPAISADGKTLARPFNADPQKNAFAIKLFDLGADKELRAIEVGTPAMYLAFSPDGRTLASGIASGWVQRWDVASGKEIGTIKPPGSRRGVVSLVFSPSGRELAMTREGASVEVWDVKANKRRHAFLENSLPPGPNPGFGSSLDAGRTELAFSPDGQWLAVGSSGCGVRLFDLATGKETGAGAHGHPVAVHALGLSADGKTLVTHARGDAIRTWDLATGEQLRAVAIPGSGGAALSADGATLAAVTGGKVELYDTATGRPKVPLQRPELVAAALTFSPDGKTLAARGTQNNVVRIWDLPTGKELPTLEGGALAAAENPLFFDRRAQVRSVELVFSPEGRHLAMKDGQDQLALFELTSGTRLRQFSLAPGQVVVRFGFSPDGRSLGAVNQDGTVTLYETVSGRKRGHFGKAAKVPGPDAAVMLSAVALDLAGPGAESPYSLAFSPDGRLLATGATGPDIRLWGVYTGQELGTFRGHQGGITSLAFDAAGKRLVSGSMDSTALVWDVTGPAKVPRPARGSLAAGAMDKLWADLAGDDAERAFMAIRSLCDAPGDAVALLQTRLRPVSAPDSKHVAKLITDLDSKSFPVRSKAMAELEKLGDLILPAAMKAWESGTLETRQRLEQILKKLRTQAVRGEALAEVRGVEVLEHIGTRLARKFIERLANGAPGASQTEAARRAMRRLEHGG